MTEKTNGTQTVGILAYGSLICDPGCGIRDNRIRIIHDVCTPFNVEFARRSTGRGKAPTLVKVSHGGSRVKCKIFVMGLSKEDTKKALFKREMRLTCKELEGYSDSDINKKISPLENFSGIDIVYYANFKDNIIDRNRTPKKLAKYAIKSVTKAAPFRDGISYFMAAKECGIVTALSKEYEKKILRRTDCKCLIQALANLSPAGRLVYENEKKRWVEPSNASEKH